MHFYPFPCFAPNYSVNALLPTPETPPLAPRSPLPALHASLLASCVTRGRCPGVNCISYKTTGTSTSTWQTELRSVGMALALLHAGYQLLEKTCCGFHTRYRSMISLKKSTDQTPFLMLVSDFFFFQRTPRQLRGPIERRKGGVRVRGFVYTYRDHKR